MFLRAGKGEWTKCVVVCRRAILQCPRRYPDAPDRLAAWLSISLFEQMAIELVRKGGCKREAAVYRVSCVSRFRIWALCATPYIATLWKPG